VGHYLENTGLTSAITVVVPSLSIDILECSYSSNGVVDMKSMCLHYIII
jgi:hypothetical protein